MVTTRSKTGSLPVTAKVDPPSLDVVSKTSRRVQVARTTARQDSKLLQLPVEILQEILSQADLIDLLNWSLCCRDLNDWLTSKRSLQIWETVTENTTLSETTYTYSYRSYGYHYQARYKTKSGTTPVELPQRPERMPYFSYARLLFSDGCVACGRDIHVRCVFTTSGLEKMCERCKKSTLVSRNYLKDIWANEDLPKHKTFWNAIPVGTCEKWGYGVPASNKPAYDLDASEAFLADYQRFEAQNGFNEAALATFIDTARKQQLDLRDFLSAFSRWPATRKAALEVRAAEIRDHWQRLQSHVDAANRENIIKRCIAENARLESNDIATAVDSLNVLAKLDRPLSDSKWVAMRSAILKEAERVSSARKKFTSIFNPECNAFREALKPYWREYTASFEKRSKDPHNIVLPTLYEFSMLPALAPLRSDSLPTAASVKRYFDNAGEGASNIRQDIDADLQTHSEDLLVQLASKLGGKRSKPGDAARRLGYPTAIFSCNSCHQSFQGLQVFKKSHMCVKKHDLSPLKYAEIGDFYESEEFQAAYDLEMGLEGVGHDTEQAGIPIKTLSDIRVDKENSADVDRILNLLPSYNIEVPEPITLERLYTAAADLTFVCEVCQRYGSHGRFKGASAMLAHFKKARSKDYCYEYRNMRGEDGKQVLHTRISIEGKTSNKRNAGKIVKYTEMDE